MLKLRGRKSAAGVVSKSFESLEGEVFEDLEMRRRLSKNKFSLPPFQIKTSHVRLSNYEIIDSYRVGLATVYVTKDLEYLIHDPPLTPEEHSMLAEVASKLLFIMPTSAVGDERQFDDYLKKAGLDDPRHKYFLKREIIGYGPLDPMVSDHKVEDVVLASSNNPVSCTHSDYGNMPSNVVFAPGEVDRYVEKLVHLSGKSVSLFRPILSIRLPDGSRLSASYKREVTVEGSSFIIRKFPEKPWSITSMMLNNTISPQMAAWLMVLEEHRKAFLVCGAMGTGKTSMINALCNLIPERAIIVTIEDTPELRLAHPNRFSLVVRESVTLDERGEIGMFALVKEALRMSADYIIVGEVRGEEGRIWAQAIMTGHGGITSLHAESPSSALERLLSHPISVDRGALRSLAGILLVGKYPSRVEGRTRIRRRVLNYYDLDPDLRLTPLFTYQGEEDRFVCDERALISSNSARRVIEETGVSEEAFLQNYRKRVKFLTRLLEISKVRAEFRESGLVAKAVWAFQSSPDSFDPEDLVCIGDSSGDGMLFSRSISEGGDFADQGRAGRNRGVLEGEWA
ncbi:MAG: type II/IV secretion system ATPase subunit [Candidatus Verstraetearchaeota archaeon]|nr:type II/IV secretion system ATPase subunit [Candidatus Verstraetearchaeota archaeon]